MRCIFFQFDTCCFHLMNDKTKTSSQNAIKNSKKNHQTHISYSMYVLMKNCDWVYVLNTDSAGVSLLTFRHWSFANTYFRRTFKYTTLGALRAFFDDELFSGYYAAKIQSNISIWHRCIKYSNDLNWLLFRKYSLWASDTNWSQFTK